MSSFLSETEDERLLSDVVLPGMLSLIHTIKGVSTHHVWAGTHDRFVPTVCFKTQLFNG